MMNKVTVMIIEDDAALLDLYKTRFEIEGFNVITASRGDEALVIAAKENPSLFMVDIMLPGVDGLKVIEELKKSPKHKNASIVALTALDLDDVKKKALAVGADEYLIKSRITLHDIVTTAQDVLEKNKSL